MRSKFKWIFTLLLALTMQFSFAQEKTITGKVSDASGPLPGVNVLIKGTKKAVSTSFDGTYSIKAKEGETLIFSFLGMADVSRVVGSDTTVNIVLRENTTELETVVVTAVGVKKRTDAITSTFQRIKSEEISQASNPSIVQSLAGKVSGLQINVTNSNVSSTSKIVLRGVRSISGNNEALVVIDGAISSSDVLQQLSPDLIDNVTVLKGAQGAALYGSDGVNGVIIVSTKKGGKGDKLSVNVTSSVDFTDIAYVPQSQLRYGQGWDGTHSSFENGSWGPEFDGSIKPVGLVQANGQYFNLPYNPIKDNIKDFFVNGKIYQNGLTLSAGNLDKGYVVFGANRTVNEFVVPGDETKRNSFLFKGGKKIGKWTLEGNVNYITQDFKEAGAGTIQGGIYQDLLNTASNIPVKLFNHGNNENAWNVYFKNPYWYLKNRRTFNSQNRLASNINIGYEFNKNISVTYLANVRMTSANIYRYNNGFVDTYSALYGAGAKNELSNYFKTSTFQREFYGDLILNFDYKLTDNISFKANIGNNMQDRYDQSIRVGGSNLEVAGLYNISNVLNPAAPSTLPSRSTLRRKIGLFGQFDFGYKDFLFLNFTGRQDYTSVFIKENNNFFYPSTGISFIPTKAFSGLSNSFLSYAKLSANYTKVGNDSAIGAYDINEVGNLGNGFPFSNNSYVLDTNVTSKIVKPEFVTTKEIAVNFGFLKDRILLDGAYYITDTDDLITSISTSNTSGLGNLTTNVGKMQTKGYDVDLTISPFKSDNRGLNWDFKVSYTQFKSIIKKVSDQSKSVELRNAGSVGIFAEEGEEYPLIKGTSFLRDDLGRFVVDANGLPTIDSNFRKLGVASPKYILGFNSSISYKGFKLATTLDYRTGHKFYSATKREFAFNGKLIESAENRYGFILPNSSYDYNGDGVYQANEGNTSVVTGGNGTTSIINYYNNRYTGAAENFVIDATALKVRELALSYSISPDIAKRIGIDGLIFGINARNFYTWLPKQNRGYNDPETDEGNDDAINEGRAAARTNLTSGLAFTNRYPTQSSYGFSVNLKF